MMPSQRSPMYFCDCLLTALAPAIWGSTYIVTSQLLPPDRPFTAALIRVLPAGLLLLLFSPHLPAWRDCGRLLILSALNIGIFQTLLFLAAYRLPGGLAAVLGAIQPLFVMVLMWGVDKRTPKVLTLLAAFTGVAGMSLLLLSSRTIFDMLGVIAALVGACSMAAGVWLAGRWKITLPITSLTGWQLVLGGLALVPAALFIDEPLPTLTTLHYLAYAWLSLAGALIAYGLWFRGIKRLPSVAVASLGLLSPIVAVLLGWIFLSQSLTLLQLTGLVIVLGSVVVVQLTARK